MRHTIKFLLRTSLLTALLSPSAWADKNPDIAETERWISELSQQLLEKGAVSGTYLNNYLQCLQDEKSLRDDPGTDLEKLWQELMGASHSCAPVIEDMVEALKKDDVQSEVLRQQLQDLEKSL